jgi:NADP-dependent 3-hydroxy acid dehydrogenase YdfG
MKPHVRVFEGQTAVVTGGGTGVGSAIALALAGTGANLHLVGRRLDALETVASKARGMGVQAVCHSGDFSTSHGQFELIQRLTRNLARVDVLVQNAAMHATGSIEHAEPSELDALYQINVRAPYVLTQALLPMLKVQRGQVVFINSSSGVIARPMSAQYDATKHALKAIANSLRGEVNAYGVRVLSVYLGRTATEMQERIHKMESKPYHPENLLQPEDIATVIMTALSLPPTAELTDIHIRPMIKT